MYFQLKFISILFCTENMASMEVPSNMTDDDTIKYLKEAMKTMKQKNEEEEEEPAKKRNKIDNGEKFLCYF